MAFESRAESFAPTLVAADAERADRARQWLEGLEVGGGTGLEEGLKAAVRLLGDEGGDILLVTDGEVFGTGSTLGLVAGQPVRVHCLGIAAAASDRFLSQLARETGGQFRSPTSRERVETPILQLFGAVGNPVAKGVKVSVAPSEPAGVVRLVGEVPPLLFADQTLVVHGEADSPCRGQLTLSFKHQGQERTLSVPFSLGPSPEAETIWLIQGAQQVAATESWLERLEDLEGLEEDKGAVRTQLEALSRRYGLASQAMALVAVMQRPGDKPGELPQMDVIPVGMPEDTSLGSSFVPQETMAPRVVYYQRLSIDTSGTGSGGARDLLEALELVEGRQMRAGSAEEAFGQAEEEDAEPELSVRERPVSARGRSSLHQALKLASRLLEDGGLPAEGEQQRWYASAMALVLLHQVAQREGQATLQPHITRLQRYLQNSVETAKDPKKKAFLERLMRGQVRLPEHMEARWLRRLLARRLPSERFFWRAFRPSVGS